MCPGVDSASKNEYQDIPGGKDGRYVRVTTFMCRVYRNSGALTYQKSQRPTVVGLLYLLFKYTVKNVQEIFSGQIFEDFVKQNLKRIRLSKVN